MSLHKEEMGENVWEPDLDAFERERERGKETIDAFMEPMQTPRKRGASYNNHSAPPPQDSVKPISVETRYNIVFSQSVNDRFASFRARAGLQTEERESGEEEEGEEELSEMELFSGLESGETTMDEGAEEEEIQQGEKRKRVSAKKKKPLPNKRVKFNRATRNECMFCSHGNSQLDGMEAPHIKKLFDIVRLQSGNRDNLETSWEAYLYYMEEVYDEADGLPVLTPEIILDHLEGMHSLNAGLYLAEMIRKETKLLFLLGEAMCLEDGTFDFKVLAEYRKSQTILNQYYKMKPDTLAFSEENNEEDMKRLASSISIQPKFTRTPPSRMSSTKKTPSPTGKKQSCAGERPVTTF